MHGTIHEMMRGVLRPPPPPNACTTPKRTHPLLTPEPQAKVRPIERSRRSRAVVVVVANARRATCPDALLPSSLRPPPVRHCLVPWDNTQRPPPRTPFSCCPLHTIPRPRTCQCDYRPTTPRRRRRTQNRSRQGSVAARGPPPGDTLSPCRCHCPPYGRRCWRDAV